MKYRVVKITNNIGGYPECKSDTEEFPEIIECVEDEMDNFIVDENGKFWQADEFFNMIEIKEFTTENENS
jgi:hypothetical protein